MVYRPTKPTERVKRQLNNPIKELGIAAGKAYRRTVVDKMQTMGRHAD